MLHRRNLEEIKRLQIKKVIQTNFTTSIHWKAAETRQAKKDKRAGGPF